MKREFFLKFCISIIALLLTTAAFAQGAGSPQFKDAAQATADSAQVAGIVFNGVVQDPSFAAGEKLNVEILESGEALQTTVGTPFSVVLPEDTLWNVCVTNSDTAGAEKEKCYELVYTGSERSFSQALGEAFTEPDSANVAASDSAGATSGDSTSASQKPDSAVANASPSDSSASPESSRVAAIPR